ncbi:MAG: hypothetical protein KKB21_00100, partial [Nanoarchaeota archaeon]|nr:hypothetical protein [Nanoarchaeota archaeon]
MEEENNGRELRSARQFSKLEETLRYFSLGTLREEGFDGKIALLRFIEKREAQGDGRRVLRKHREHTKLYFNKFL